MLDLGAELEALRRPHHKSPDCWYSCPLALDHDGDSACCDENRTDSCTCGADAHNARIDALLARLIELSAGHDLVVGTASGSVIVAGHLELGDHADDCRSYDRFGCSCHISAGDLLYRVVLHQ